MITGVLTSVRQLRNFRGVRFRVGILQLVQVFPGVWRSINWLHSPGVDLCLRGQRVAIAKRTARDQLNKLLGTLIHEIHD